MSDEQSTRRLAAILAADIVGYSRLMESDEAGTLAAWRALQAPLIEQVVAAHRGRIFKRTGDGFLTVFDSAVDAAGCAVKIQEAVTNAQSGVEPVRRIVLRIGVNLGDVYLQDDDVLGDGVIVARRLETAAEPGGVLVTRAVADEVRGRLDVELVDVGQRTLKNAARPVWVTRLSWGPTTASPTTFAATTRAKHLTVRVLGATLMILALVGGWYGWNTLGTSTPRDPRPTVAVLPFSYGGDDAVQRDFADGLTEDVITALGRFTSLAVISRNSSFRYKDSKADLQTLERELGAGYVLHGSIRRDGERIRISVQLADTANGSQIWAERYEREGKEVFALQDDIAQSVASMLVGHVTHAETQRSLRKRDGNLDAYELYVRGLALQRRHIATSEPGNTLLQARALFERAIKLDPRFAPSHEALANNYLAAFVEPNVEGELRNPAILDRAAAAAEEALRLEPTNASALATLAWVARNRGSKEGMEQAEMLFRRAQAENPSLADGRFADVLIYQGRPAEALEVARGVMRLDHFYPPSYDGYVGHAYIMLGRAKEGIASLERCMARAPAFRPCHYWLAAALADSGRVAEARGHVEMTRKIDPNFSATDPVLMQLYQRAEDRERMASALERAGFPR